MTRPKGSLNKIQRPKVKYVRKPKPKEEKSEYLTLKDLKAIAKERGVKLVTSSSRNTIREKLGLGPVEAPKRYDHCKGKKAAQVMIKTNTTTGEETRYKSIFELANSVKMFAGSITYRLKHGKDLVFDGVTYKIRKESIDDLKSDEDIEK